jgi:glutamyl-tRNA reductase
VQPQTVEQARRMLDSGRDAGEVIDFLSTTLTNRLMHGPSQRLRNAAEEGDAELFRALHALFSQDAGQAAVEVVSSAELKEN